MSNLRYKYVEWLSAEDMHLMSKKWLSELFFVKNEQQFFEGLIRKYIFQLIQPNRQEKSVEIVNRLSDLQKENDKMISLVQSHENGLEVLLDGKDELIKEEVYKLEHKKMIGAVSDFLEKYKDLKKVLFNTVAEILKVEKEDN